MQYDSNSKNTSQIGFFNDLNYRSILEVFLIIIVVVVFLKSFVLEFYRVESESMETELYEDDVVLVSRLAYFLGFPSRFPIFGISIGSDFRLNYRSPVYGDIVVIDGLYVKNIIDNNFVIKRIVGLPGDTLITKKNIDNNNTYSLKKNSVISAGKGYVIPHKGDIIEININNINFYSHLFNYENSSDMSILDSLNSNPFYITKYKFENNYYFVQGDNTKVSYDSRNYGLISENSIIGKAIMLLNSSNNQVSRSFRFL